MSFISLNSQLGRNISYEELSVALKNGFESNFKVKFENSELDEVESDSAEPELSNDNAEEISAPTEDQEARTQSDELLDESLGENGEGNELRVTPQEENIKYDELDKRNWLIDNLRYID